MKKSEPKKRPNPQAENRRSHYEVEVERTYEAGIVLTGDEIKSIRSGHVQLTGAYVRLMRAGKLSGQLPQPVLIGAHLSQAARPERSRALLLHAKELREIEGSMQAKGKLAVPLKLYLKKGWAKVLVGVGRGRRQYDKRAVLRRRDVERQQSRELKGLKKA